MKILYGYRYGIVGGVSTQLLLRRKALSDVGIRCELFFSQDNGLKPVLSDRDGIHFGTEVQFSRLVRKGHFDAVIVIDSPELLSAAVGPLYRRNPVYLDVHTTTSTGLAYLSEINPSRLDGVTVPTRYSARLVGDRLPNATQIHVLPNVLNTEVFTPAHDLLIQGVRKCKPNVAREFVWVGKLDHHKNWRLALVYAAMLKGIFADVHMHMVGGFTASESQAESFFQLAYRLGISDRVHWLDRVKNTELAALYQRCATSGGAMLVTSRDESFGMAAAEALLCGCPLIANDLPVFREVFPDSALVHRVDIWQPEDVAAAAELLTGVSGREASSLARELADRYGPRAFVDSFKNLLAVWK